MSEEKETIINGIDVSECDAYKDEHCKYETSIMFCDTNLCCNYPDCYFKQLKRLQEKNKAYAKLMLQQQEVSQKYWECIEKIKQAIEVLAETCNVYPLKANLDKLITTINEVLEDSEDDATNNK